MEHKKVSEVCLELQSTQSTSLTMDVTQKASKKEVIEEKMKKVVAKGKKVQHGKGKSKNGKKAMSAWMIVIIAAAVVLILLFLFGLGFLFIF